MGEGGGEWRMGAGWGWGVNRHNGTKMGSIDTQFHITVGFVYIEKHFKDVGICGPGLGLLFSLTPVWIVFFHCREEDFRKSK